MNLIFQTINNQTIVFLSIMYHSVSALFIAAMCE